MDTSNVSLHRDDLKKLLGAYTKDQGKGAMKSAFATYTSNWGAKDSKETIKRTLVDVGTDYIFLIPIQVALYLHANAT